jgi:hypothetical protein
MTAPLSALHHALISNMISTPSFSLRTFLLRLYNDQPCMQSPTTTPHHEMSVAGFHMFVIVILCNLGVAQAHSETYNVRSFPIIAPSFAFGEVG